MAIKVWSPPPPKAVVGPSDRRIQGNNEKLFLLKCRYQSCGAWFFEIWGPFSFSVDTLLIETLRVQMRFSQLIQRCSEDDLCSLWKHAITKTWLSVFGTAPQCCMLILFRKSLLKKAPPLWYLDFNKSTFSFLPWILRSGGPKTGFGGGGRI